MVKKDMWSWVNDGKIVEKFGELKILEIIFFCLSALLFSLDYFHLQLKYLWVGVGSILLISRPEILVVAFSWSKISLKNFFRIDSRIYLVFLFSALIVFSMVFKFPDSWLEIKTSIRNMSYGATFLNEIYDVFKEEVLFRLLLYYSLNRIFGRSFAFLGTVAMFSLMHHMNSAYYPLAVVPAGILFSVFAIVTGSIWSSFALHLIFNIIVYIFAVNFL